MIECLIYLAVVMVVMGAAVAVFFQALDFSRHLQGNAEDVARALEAGERWRADVRAATAPPSVEEAQGALALHIPQNQGEVTYLFITNVVFRGKEADHRVAMMLKGVKGCTFHRDQHGPVVSWRWELELASRMKAARVRPLFTFMAVDRAETGPATNSAGAAGTAR